MNRRSKLFSLLTASLLNAFAIGCMSTPVRFETSSAPIAANTASRPVQSSACGFQLLLLIPIAVNSRQARAYEGLKAQAGGDVLVDIKVSERWFYGLVGSGYCTELSATAYAKG